MEDPESSKQQIEKRGVQKQPKFQEFQCCLVGRNHKFCLSQVSDSHKARKYNLRTQYKIKNVALVVLFIL